ncbi:MAG TPA: GNAT family N-acetyltransferase [Candidatus Competibacteraceae bacterium]|nr:GNAT family N-acetyltransferase [Candidatus Competibacteraceae bacterium]
MKFVQPFAESNYALSHGQLRLLQESEIPLIAAALAAMDPWKALNYRAADLAHYLRSIDPALWRYTTHSLTGNLAGVICVRYPWLRGPYLELLGLTPDHQGLGLGGELMEWFTQQARLCARNAWVVVSVFNRRAHMFYRRHGFTEVGVIEGLVKPGYQEILLRKLVRKEADDE